MDILNTEQKSAVEHIEGPLLILAGAGSGKTRVVTSRVCHLLSLGVPSDEILAVTFTNKAAKEMQKRVGERTDQRPLVCTFHSLGALILRESIGALGYPLSFSIYDSSDQHTLLRNILKEMGLSHAASDIKEYKRQISQAKGLLHAPEDVEGNPVYEGTFLKVYKAYQDALKNHHSVDFDDLLFLVHRLFREHPDYLEQYRKRWSFFLVDEYQDTNEAQYLLIKLLIGEKQNFFAVGDPDQSIYSWRGANIQNILNFESDFPNARLVKLEQNYRSTEQILCAANEVIANNQQRYEKNLYTEKGKGSPLVIHSCESDREEASLVISQIKKAKREGVSYDEMVIFYRINAQSRSFEEAFLRCHIPYTIVGGLSFYERREIKDLLSYIRLLSSHFDPLSFIRAIQAPKRGLGPKACQTCIDLILGRPLVTILNDIPLYKELSMKQRESFYGFVQVLKDVADVFESTQSMKKAISELIDATDYLAYCAKDKETYEDRKGNINELLAKAHEWDQATEDKTIDGFLEETALSTSEVGPEDDASSVKLMTVHHGKGLEFSYVWVVGMEEYLFPHANCMEDESQVEEERRLFYVAMTRAKNELAFSWAKHRTVWGTPRYMERSRFLGEIPRKYLSQGSISSFATGQKVFHKDFKEGVIRSSTQTRLGRAVEVYFYTLNDTRTIVLKFGSLELL